MCPRHDDSRAATASKMGYGKAAQVTAKSQNTIILGKIAFPTHLLTSHTSREPMPASNVTPFRRPSAQPRLSWLYALHDVAGSNPDAAVVFERFELAFAESHARDDTVSQMALSAHAMAFMVADWSRFSGWQAWVERFELADSKLIDADCNPDSSLARATGAMACALLRGESLKTMAPLGERLQSMIGPAGSAHQATNMALAASLLLPLFQMTRAISDAQLLHAQMTDIWSRWKSANAATEFLSLVWFVSWAQHWHFANPARLPETLAELDAAMNSAQQEIVKCGVSFRHARVLTDNALHRKSDESVQHGLHAMLAALHPARPMERVIYNAQAAIFASSRNDPDGAMRHVGHMNRGLQAADCPPSISAIYRAREGAIYLGMERYALAMQAFEAAISSIPDAQSAVPIGYVSLARALESLRQGDFRASLSPQCAQDLRDGLAAVRSTSTHGFFFSAPKARGAVCAIAFRESIEPEFVREALKLVPTAPPTWADENWPWAMSLRSFGGFRAQVTIAPGQRADKASSRPLLLLKLIAAYGAHGVTVTTAMDALWPGQDGDQAEHALTVTLQRLRKLYVADELILRSDGWLQLNPATVWTDVRALEVHLDSLPALLTDSKRDHSHSARHLEGFVTRLFDLYRGDCLHGVDEAWALDRASHYRTRVGNAVRQCIAEAQRAGHQTITEHATTLALERGLNVKRAT